MWLSQLCLCPLNRPPCPCGDLGGFPPWPWLSVLGEDVFLVCVCGLEWEGGLEDRRGFGVYSCAVTEIWGSERPVEETVRVTVISGLQYAEFKTDFFFNFMSTCLSE